MLNSTAMRPLATCLALVTLAAVPAPAAEHKAGARPALCLAVSQAPVIDGKLDDPAWQTLAPLGQLFLSGTSQPGDPPTTLWVAHDGADIFIALRCAEPKMAAVRGELTKPDADIFEGEDSAVVLLDAGHKRRAADLVELAANLLGTKHDAFGDDHKWNGAWRVAVQRGADYWTMEMAVPFADLRAQPAAGDLWGFNVGRYRYVEGHEQLFVWSPAGSFWSAETLGDLVFDSFAQNLMRDIEQVQERIHAGEAEAAKLMPTSEAEDPYLTALSDIRDSVADLRRRVADGVTQPDQWRELKDAISRAATDYEDALWDLRFERLFAE